jgi:hypothetical protein
VCRCVAWLVAVLVPAANGSSDSACHTLECRLLLLMVRQLPQTMLRLQHVYGFRGQDYAQHGNALFFSSAGEASARQLRVFSRVNRDPATARRRARHASLGF